MSRDEAAGVIGRFYRRRVCFAYGTFVSTSPHVVKLYRGKACRWFNAQTLWQDLTRQLTDAPITKDFTTALLSCPLTRTPLIVTRSENELRRICIAAHRKSYLLRVDPQSITRKLQTWMTDCNAERHRHAQMIQADLFMEQYTRDERDCFFAYAELACFDADMTDASEEDLSMDAESVTSEESVGNLELAEQLLHIWLQKMRAGLQECTFLEQRNPPEMVCDPEDKIAHLQTLAATITEFFNKLIQNTDNGSKHFTKYLERMQTSAAQQLKRMIDSEHRALY